MNRPSKHGVHNEDLVSFSGRVKPELLALVKITSEQCNCTGMDLLRKGVETIAISKKIIVDGKISPEFKEAYDLQLEIINLKRQNHLKQKKGLDK